MSAALAAGYHGPAELTVPRAFTSWTFDPWVCAAVIIIGGGYLLAVRRLRQSGQDWPAVRAVAFCGLGLGMLVLAAMWWPAAYDGVLFYARAVQTILLLLVTPLFLALGRPLTLLTEVLPPAVGDRVSRAIRGRTARVLTFPAITTLVLVAVPFVVYFSRLYTAYFHHVAVKEATFLLLMAPGYVFFWTLLRVDPVPKEYPYLVSLWITGTEVIGDAVLGLAVIGNSHLIGGAWYAGLHRPWGPSLRFDQMLGGATLWMFGDLVGLPFLAAQFIHMMREDESQAAADDAELDAREAVREAAKVQESQENSVGGTDASTPTAPAEPGADRPWWESDPRFTERFSPAAEPDQVPKS